MTAFVHRFEKGSAAGAPPILLLHGTGGNENDLIDLGRAVAPGSALLSPRGNVLEHGMPRFFRRLAEGVFDEDDVKRRADELADFVVAARRRYGIEAPIALGFSNGANIAAALLLQRPEVLSGAVLLRAIMPFAEPPAASIPGTPVMIISGAQDPIVPTPNAAQLATQLHERGAHVEHRIVPAGHGLTQSDVNLAAAFIKTAATTPAL
ncbi:MAG: alpha/beta hydrolase [Proteobacteria bacterium]|nr:alpha/beta hydrolase [Pseudomonadota bacterium]